MKITTISLVSALLFIACSAPKPVNLDNNKVTTINQALLQKQEQNIPLDPFLQKNSWFYSVIISKTKDGYILDNDDVVRTFLVAHNASKIILIGKNELAQEVKRYFTSNGVVANIDIIKVSGLSLRNENNIVQALFFREDKK